jgi:hypothetical protein
MSLDIYLNPPQHHTCPHCGGTITIASDEFGFSQNITHNLGAMAEAAGLYRLLWHPEENDIVTARQLIEPLRNGIQAMRDDPAKFQAYNSLNGWGLYENFLPWLESLLAACEKMPDYLVEASR